METLEFAPELLPECPVGLGVEPEAILAESVLTEVDFAGDVLSEVGLVELDMLLSELLDSQRRIGTQFLVQLRLAEFYRRRYLVHAGSGTGLPYRSMVAELALQLRFTERAAEQLLDLAAKFESQLCETAFALEHGFISVEQAKVIASECVYLEAESFSDYELGVLEKAVGSKWIVGVGPELPVFDVEGRVRGLNPARLRQVAKRITGQLTAATLEERHREASQLRRVELEPADDGMAWLHLYGPAPELVAVHQGIHRAARGLKQQLQADPARFGHYPDQLPVLEQLKFDIALDLLLLGDVSKKKIAKRYRNGRTYRRKYGFLQVRPVIYLTVPTLTLLGVDDIPAELHGYGPIDVDTATRLTASASAFRRVLTDPETGVILSVGRSQYRVTKGMREALLIRDQRCRFPGCGMPAYLGDLDHTIAWQHGGATSTQNLAYLCRRHHTLKHVNDTDPVYGWQVSQDHAGALTWRSPTGRAYSTRPTPVTTTRLTPMRT